MSPSKRVNTSVRSTETKERDIAYYFRLCFSVRWAHVTMKTEHNADYKRKGKCFILKFALPVVAVLAPSQILRWYNWHYWYKNFSVSACVSYVARENQALRFIILHHCSTSPSPHTNLKNMSSLPDRQKSWLVLGIRVFFKWLTTSSTDHFMIFSLSRWLAPQSKMAASFSRKSLARKLLADCHGNGYGDRCWMALSTSGERHFGKALKLCIVQLIVV